MKKDSFYEIEDWVKELLDPSLPFTPKPGREVPTIEHNHLTVNAKSDLRSVVINACVMHIDLRESTKFNALYPPEITSKVYTAFVRLVLQSAAEHQGSVRNIIGDRVMIIFVGSEAYKNAVDCAVSCNHLLSNLQASFTNLVGKEFKIKAGIGIDFGEMNVVLVGVTRRGKEGYDNQNLVWLGQPANIASKLTDMAGKPKSVYRKIDGKLKIDTITYSPILITENVYEGLKATQPYRLSLVKELWVKKELNVGSNKITTYGANLIWVFNN